jgi:hypothetical protein
MDLQVEKELKITMTWFVVMHLIAYANGCTADALVEQENRQIIFLNHGSAPHAPSCKIL